MDPYLWIQQLLAPSASAQVLFDGPVACIDAAYRYAEQMQPLNDGEHSSRCRYLRYVTVSLD